MKIGRNRVSLTQGIRLSKNFYFGSGLRAGLAGNGAFGFAGNANLQVIKLLQGSGAFGFNGAGSGQTLGAGSGTFGFTGAGNAISQAFDPDYQAVLDYATTQGYTLPSAAQQDLQNQLVLDLKSAGIWDKLDLFYLPATNGNIDFARINWKAPSGSFNLTLFNSPTFTENQGFNGNGSTSYVDFNYVPDTDNTNLSLNSASIGFWSLDTISSVTISNMGTRNDPFADRLMHIFNNQIRVNSDSELTVSAVTDSGFYIYNRVNATTVNRYVNGVLNGSGTLAVSTNLPSYSIYGCATNNAGLGASFYSSNRISCWYVASDLTSEASAFYTAINTYLSSI